MLQSISWSEFFSFVSLGLAAYYGVAGLLLYREEIKAILIQRRPSIIDSSSESEHQHPNESVSLLGAVATEVEREPDGQSVQTSELQFLDDSSVAEEVNPPPVHTQHSLETTMTGLFKDINALAEVVSDNSKEEVESMFRLLLEKYPQLINYKDSLSQFIVNTCRKFSNHAIEQEEVNSWWPEVASN